MRNGQIFESEIVFACKKEFKNSEVIDCVKTNLDVNEGCDLIIDGIRFDLTTDFSHKDHMTISNVVRNIGYGIEVRYGIRVANSHKGTTKFSEPVVVLGVDFVLNGGLDFLIENIVNNITDIICDGFNVYDDYMEGAMC